MTVNTGKIKPDKKPTMGICPECKSFSINLESHRAFHKIKKEIQEREFKTADK